MPDTTSPLSTGTWLAERAIRTSLWAVLCFYLLGFVPGVPSPIAELKTIIAAHDKTTVDAIKENVAVQREMLKTLRAICARQSAAGAWVPCE